MFNFGWGELLVIGIVALIAIGPKELPTVLRTIGQALGKVRRMANEFQGQFQEAMREAEIVDLQKQADDIANSVNKEVTDIAQFDPMADTQQELEKTFDATEPVATAETPAEATAEPAAESSPATADVAQIAPPEPDKPLPQIDVPLPDEMAPVTEKDFAVAVEPPAGKEPKKQSKKQARGQGVSQS
jgi:sec-independent protein translocase protein TatB